MILPFTIGLPAFVLFAGASFFFALAESSLHALDLWRARRLAERDGADRRARDVMRLLENPQDLLGTLVLGNSLANAALVTLGLLMVLGRGGAGLLAGGVTAIGLTLLVCEVAPKTLGVRAPERWSLRVAGPMAVLMRGTGPLRRVAQAVVDGILAICIPRGLKPLGPLTDEEYAELIELGHQQGSLRASEKEILLNILSLDRSTAGDVMRPRAAVVMVRHDLPVAAMREVACRARHLRIPVYDETPDTVVGILNTRTFLLSSEGDLDEALEFPSFVPESMNLLKLLEALQRQQRGMAVVVDEFGGMAGIVTVEDILEHVVGEIRTEGETRGFVSEQLGPGKWRASGSMRLDDLRREYPALGEVGEVDTLGGLVVKECEIVPPEGRVVMFRGLRLTVREADARRIRELLVEVVRPEGGAS